MRNNLNLNPIFGEGSQPNQVLFDINLAVKNGEIFGLVDEPGFGKTTVLKCLVGLFTTGRCS
ncbi:ATP-binding cassette domain-containing protein [Yersinia sp. Marseille-Q3913]|uniref:ATP-binding cassette domain-containing protein n=1 Tax=Yersinia sp. Marseille-Q3913 TaxID=2830769 RepID=UPI00201200E1|nr:ATP-binding cassette domain-containing protein [Yersinia sp. Marseille-Q3913]